jgi:protein DEK
MASDEAKPASPAAADPPADDAKENADPEPGTMADAEDGTKQEGEEEQKTPQQPEKRRGRRKRGEAEADKKTPTPNKPTPGIERPSRERKTVERYAELASRVTPAKKPLAILQVSRSFVLARSTLICCLRTFFRASGIDGFPIVLTR